MAVVVKNVIPHSPAAKKGMRAGDVLRSINGNAISDVLDYDFYITESKLAVEYARGDKIKTIHIKKEQYQPLGLEFETFLMDAQHSCTNHCIFCFVDQTPPGMRPSLYFKDDDARLSFLMGNYITLTNLKQPDIDRILKMHISPINVSVHTTDPELRCKMMGNRFAGEKLDYLRQLAQGGITVHCQCVLCPGINDGPVLERTLKELGDLYPGVQSIACVPVGLTKHRKGLYPLQPYTPAQAGEVIDLLEKFAAGFYAQHGTHLAYASDEFYLLAGRPLPEEDYYEDFSQLENGVGVIATLVADFRRAWEELPGDEKPRKCSVATGTSAAPFLQQLAVKAKEKYPNLDCRVYPIINHFWGETITVAGLVTAGDMMEQLKGQELGEVLFLPDCMLRHQQDFFLDDKTVQDVENALGVKVQVIPAGGEEFAFAITGEETVLQPSES